MVNNFYTLQALVREWRGDLVGTTVGDAFSQVRNELSLAFAHPEREQMIRCSVERPLLFIFRSAGYSKARRNVATLFEPAFDREVEEVRIAKRDRMIYLDLAGGWRFQIMLFGARANVFLVDAEGFVVEAFRNSEKHAGEEAPDPRAAPQPETFEAFEERWRPERNTTAQALSSAIPLFDRTLAEETIYRAEVETDDPAACTEEERRALFAAANALRKELEDPVPRIYGEEHFPNLFSLVDLHHRKEPEERFPTVDEAVRIFVRRRLAEAHFERLYDPLEKALEDATERNRQRAERVRSELMDAGRADRYEHFGHLLMAMPGKVPEGAEEVTLPDLFSEEQEPVTIPLDPARSAVENAERYYDKAQAARREREHAQGRLEDAEERAAESEVLLEELRQIETLDALKKFRKAEAERLAPFISGEEEGIERLPFRRFDLGSGYEVWVGKNARQNDELTFHHAQKYDLWMHARGLPGAHAVLRLPNRDADPPKRIVHQAASIAAYYSKGRGSKLVPVMVTERKYVRSPSGAPPGAVRAEREEVLLVEPRLPAGKG